LFFVLKAHGILFDAVRFFVLISTQIRSI